MKFRLVEDTLNEVDLNKSSDRGDTALRVFLCDLLSNLNNNKKVTLDPNMFQVHHLRGSRNYKDYTVDNLILLPLKESGKSPNAALHNKIKKDEMKALSHKYIDTLRSLDAISIMQSLIKNYISNIDGLNISNLF